MRTRQNILYNLIFISATLIVCLALLSRTPASAVELYQQRERVETRIGNRNIPAALRFDNFKNADFTWRLEADNLISFDDGIIVEASGDVVLRHGNDYLRADFARYFTATNWVYISGNVKAHIGQDELTASTAEFDLTSNTGWLKDGSVFMAGPHIYFTGESVTKHWGDRYTFHNAKITSCDGPAPAWSFAAEQAKVEIDGYATLIRSSFQLRETGILFAPYLILPAKTTRQSGLLPPTFGASSLNGAYFTLPWFWAVSESRDMTFYLTWMDKIGFMPSIEYRSRPDDHEITWLALDALYDKHLVLDDHQDPVDATDGKIRDNNFRFWLRGMSQGQLGASDWYYKYNLDYVSDQNFLRQFQRQMTGFQNTRAATLDLFGRNLQEADKNRVSEGYIYREWERLTVAIGARYEQNPSLGHGNESLRTDTTTQHLPEINTYLHRGRLGQNLPLEIEASASSAYMHRRSGARGLRSELYPKLNLPVDLKYASLIASAGLRQAFYTNKHHTGASPISTIPGLRPAQTHNFRTIPDFSLKLFTQANRVWELNSGIDPQALPQVIGSSYWSAIRHTIQPRLTYEWIPSRLQDSNPFYILADRILPTNTISFDITNFLTIRKHSVIAPEVHEENDSTPPKAELVTDYQDIFRIRLGGGYDFQEARRTRYLDHYERRPGMDLMADMAFSPSDWLIFHGQTYYSVYGDGITRSDISLQLNNARFGSWLLGYSNRSEHYDYLHYVKHENFADIHFPERVNLLSNEIFFKPSSRWLLGVLSNVNLKTGKFYETKLSLSYLHQCYRITGRFTSKGRERSYQFNIELLGFNE